MGSNPIQQCSAVNSELAGERMVIKRQKPSKKSTWFRNSTMDRTEYITSLYGYLPRKPME
jgi:hypothetical protein